MKIKGLRLGQIAAIMHKQGLTCSIVTTEGRFYSVIRPRLSKAAYRLPTWAPDAYICFGERERQDIFRTKKGRYIAVFEHPALNSLTERNFRHERVLGHAAWYRLIRALLRKGAAVVKVAGGRFTSLADYKNWVLSNNLNQYIDAEHKVARLEKRRLKIAERNAESPRPA